MVLNDCTFTYGFNRWGLLTNEPNEVISGNFSMTSRLDEFVYKNVTDSNWFEFMYSNFKYIHLSKNTTYTLTFDYKIIEPIFQHIDSSLEGYAYVLARSKSLIEPDTSVSTFATKSYEIDTVYTHTYTFTTGNSDDYYIVIGTYGKGVITIDNLVIHKA